MQTQKIQKWGNSLALRLPTAFARSAQIEEGTTVGLELHGDDIVIKPIKAKKRLNLDELLATVNPADVTPSVWSADAGTEKLEPYVE